VTGSGTTASTAPFGCSGPRLRLRRRHSRCSLRRRCMPRRDAPGRCRIRPAAAGCRDARMRCRNRIARARSASYRRNRNRRSSGLKAMAFGTMMSPKCEVNAPPAPMLNSVPAGMNSVSCMEPTQKRPARSQRPSLRRWVAGSQRGAINCAPTPRSASQPNRPCSVASTRPPSARRPMLPNRRNGS